VNISIRPSLRPGDHVVFKDEGEERPAVVQSVNAADRTASLLFTDTGSIEMATLLQLDTQGNPDDTTNGPGSEGIGVNLGDFVFIHKMGETNASPDSRVPRIGEVDSWVHEHAFDDNEELTGWRKAMHDIGSNIAAQRSNTRLIENAIHRPVQRSGQLSWCGEVTAVCPSLVSRVSTDLLSAKSRRYCSGDTS
jgi:ubiquitin-conjugating enzyme E2 O